MRGADRPRPGPQVQVAARALPKSQERAGASTGRRIHRDLGDGGQDRRRRVARRHVHPSRPELDAASLSGRQLSHHPRAADRQDPRPGPEAAALEPGEERAGAAACACGATDDAAPAAAAIELPPETAAQAAERERREQLSAQRASAELCQKQFDEAGHAWRAAFDSVVARPEQARQDTEDLTRALLDKMLVDGDMCIRLLTCNAGDNASAHAMNVTVISLLMGRVFGLGDEEMLDLGTGRAAARRRQDRPARAAAPCRRALRQGRPGRLPRPCGARRAARQAHGPETRGAAGAGAAPRACRRQRLPAEAEGRAPVRGGAHRRAGQPLRQPVQPAVAGQRTDAARGAVAAVRAGALAVRRQHAELLHPHDGRVPGRLGGAAHRRPLCAGDERQLHAPAQAQRAGARPAAAARGSAAPEPDDHARPGHPAQPEARAAAGRRAGLPGAAPARGLLLRSGARQRGAGRGRW